MQCLAVAPTPSSKGRGVWGGAEGGANLIWTEVPVGRVQVQPPPLILWTKTLRLLIYRAYSERLCRMWHGDDILG